jgi:hypothetical protein
MNVRNVMEKNAFAKGAASQTQKHLHKCAAARMTHLMHWDFGAIFRWVMDKVNPRRKWEAQTRRLSALHLCKPLSRTQMVPPIRQEPVTNASRSSA